MNKTSKIPKIYKPGTLLYIENSLGRKIGLVLNNNLGIAFNLDNKVSWYWRDLGATDGAKIIFEPK